MNCVKQWEQSQKYRDVEGDIRGMRPSDRELWRSSLISELPRWDKGPLKSQETEQSKSLCTFQEKQHATETQRVPGRRCAWRSDESSHRAFAVNYWSRVTPNKEEMSWILNYWSTLIRPALIAVGRVQMLWNCPWLWLPGIFRSVFYSHWQVFSSKNLKTVRSPTPLAKKKKNHHWAHTPTSWSIISQPGLRK